MSANFINLEVTFKKWEEIGRKEEIRGVPSKLGGLSGMSVTLKQTGITVFLPTFFASY